MADEPDTEEPTKGPETIAGSDILEKALTLFDDISVATTLEREWALEDRRFASIAGAQWEGPWLDQFENSIRVEVNKTAQGVEKIIADYRENRVIVNFRAVGDDSSEHTAETLNGMFRADVYASKGQQAFDNAFDEGVNGGIGAWRLTNVYEDEYDPDDERQRIAFEPIVDADQSVFWDPNSRLYDKSDAMYCFVLSAMGKRAFSAEYGDHPADWPPGVLKRVYDWYTPDIVRIAEYYEVEIVPAYRLTFRHKVTEEVRKLWQAELEADDLADMLIEGWEQASRKKVKRRQIVKYVLSGAAVLEPRKIIAGDQIPIIPYYGKRWFIDNMERSRGHVRLAKDPQRIYNAQISKLTETAALSPIERPVFTPEQVAGHEASWAEANIKRNPYSLINPQLDAEGNRLPDAPITMLTPPQLAPVLAALIQITAQDIAELTSADDGADEVKSNISAEAMDIAATRTDAKSGIYMDNFRQSMQRCGEVYKSMARDVYVEDGRIVQTMDDSGADGTAVLMEPHTDDKTQAYTIRNDLAAGQYKVIADVTEATSTRKDKTVKTLVSVAQLAATTNPELANVCLSTALINMDGEGMADLQAYVRKQLVAQGAIKPTDEEQAEMDKAAQEQQPDPQAQLAQAAAAAQAAQAEKDHALSIKAAADTKLSQANALKALADAHRTNVEAGHEHEHGGDERKVGMFEKLGKLLQPQKKAA